MVTACLLGSDIIILHDASDDVEESYDKHHKMFTAIITTCFLQTGSLLLLIIDVKTRHVVKLKTKSLLSEHQKILENSTNLHLHLAMWSMLKLIIASIQTLFIAFCLWLQY